MERIGILGGTFNPIHNIHIRLGLMAYEQFGLDYILLVPAGDPYFKSRSREGAAELLPASVRLHMTELAVENDSRFQVSDLEIRREGRTYTVDTLRELSLDQRKLYFIMGEDSFRSLHLWKNADEIAGLATLLVAMRPEDGSPVNRKEEMLAIRQDYLNRIPGAEIAFLDMEESDVSSTEIREAVGRQDMAYLQSVLPEAVLQYILQEHLYERRGENGGDEKEREERKEAP